MNTYGVLNQDNCHIDVSKTERGAKQYATRHGYKLVSIRYNLGYNAKVIAKKVNGKWVNE
jgi:hypothetical protein